MKFTRAVSLEKEMGGGGGGAARNEYNFICDSSSRACL